jgi:hypothetical protein
VVCAKAGDPNGAIKDMLAASSNLDMKFLYR